MSAKREPFTRISMLVDFQRIVSNAGLSPREMMVQAGVPMDRLDKPTERLPLRVLADLINIASDKVGDPLFGIRLGMQLSPQSLGAVGVLVTLAPTLRSAIAGAGRYLRLFNNGPSLSLTIDRSTAIVTYNIPQLGDVDSRQYSECAIAGCVRLIVGVLGEGWAPDRVVLAHDFRVPKHQYESRYGTSVESRPGNIGPSLLFPVEALDFANQLTDPLAHAALERHLAEQLRIGHSSEDLLELLRHEISRNLLGGEKQVTVSVIAESLGFSVRTLQRRLFDKNTSFDELVDDIRQVWARQYLDDERLTVSDVAYLLGYSELSSFTRAFHRWTGDSPTDYRRARGRAVA